MRYETGAPASRRLVRTRPACAGGTPADQPPRRRRSILGILVLLVSVAALAQQPADANGWFQLGAAKHDAHDYAAALAAYTKAQEMHFGAANRLRFRIARVYAAMGEKEKAYTELKALVVNGFQLVDQLNAENDFLPIRTDPRWTEVVQTASRNAHPCTSSPEYRQFDYWLGEWDVQSAGQKIASSSIQSILDDCVIFENYTAAGGYAGKSFSIWDANAARWEQRYVDTGGSLHTWTGGLEGGQMRFYWTYTRGGVKTMNRMTYIKEGPDRVRQVLEASTDDGKTWTPNYDGLYVRKK